MALTTLSTPQDIEQYIIGIVKGIRPDANTAAGFPLYDIIVRSYRDIVYNERNIVNVAGNIARVLPLFDDAGNLLYPELKDSIIDRFFINTNTETRTLATIKMYFNKRCNFSTPTGSKVSLGGVFLELLPKWVSADGDEWEQDTLGYYVFAEVYTDDNTQQATIPASDAWDFSAVAFSYQTPGAQISKIVTTTVINTVITPVLTLDTVKNSISNRSWSNKRALNYNLRNNTAVHSEQLKKYEILRYSDTCFIDGYQILSENALTSEQVIAKVSGHAKTLLDYGTDLYVTPVTLEYIPYPQQERFEDYSVKLSDDSYSQIQRVTLGGVTDANSDVLRPGTLYLLITSTYAPGQHYIQFTLYKDAACTTGVAQSAVISINSTKSGLASLTSLSSSGVFGAVYFNYSADVTSSAPIIVSRITNTVYKANIPDSAGVILPVALIASTDTATASSLAQAYLTKLGSSSVDDIIPYGSSAEAIFDNAGFTVEDDVDNQVQTIGVDPAFPSAYRGFMPQDTLHNTLYWRVVKSVTTVTVSISLDPEFLDPTRLVAQGSADNTYTAGTTISLTSYNSMAMAFKVIFSKNFADIVSNVLTGNRVLPAGSILGFANNKLYLGTRIVTGEVSQYHNKTAYLVYYGTNPQYMQDAQAVFSSPSNIEVANNILAAPFKGVSFTTYYHQDYIYPYRPKQDSYTPGEAAIQAAVEALRAKYVNAQIALRTFFADYTGRLSDINFSNVCRDIYSSTGIYVKRLDYTLITQRGYLIRGHVDISLDITSTFDFNAIIAQIETGVDNAMLGPNFGAVVDTRESAITSEHIYKPVFSKVVI